jgi:hypothetical protein
MRSTVQGRWWRILLSCCGVLICSIGTAMGADTGTDSAAADGVGKNRPATEDSTWRHLKSAADHLRSAGRKELAEKLLAEAEDLRLRQTLAKKLDELAELRAEVGQLQADLNVGRVVQLRMQILECQVDDSVPSGRELLRQLNPRQDRDREGTASYLFCSLDSDDLVAEVIRELKTHGTTRVLAEPQLATLSGQSASLHTGGLHPVLVPQSTGHAVVEFCELGTRVDAIPFVYPDGTLRLDLRFSVREVDADHEAEIGGNRVPGIRACLLDTTIEMNVGRTAVFLTDAAGSPEATATEGPDRKLLLFTVTPEFGDIPRQAHQPAAGTSTETR